ncbi:hypothetical protein DW083_17335 [Parabacteroides sp. AF48-14]|jgi:hypothetical protein|uniref:hypothetical protein n=1 Tax=Parabacteroides sp. AF48-14 TaxID=2292052 RepID=UPI000EFFEF60|nr:hypothetical protein [Parabacteroides sp. AF48-14]RHO67737.1 hypothetical protein DW083_17335 [Parabacteroides sp. AF48-14]
MKYKVTYTLQREVSVIVDIKDKELNDEFKRLGEIKSDSDFNELYDPRWKIEEKAYEEFSGGEHYEDGEEAIVDRSIIKFKN